MIYFFYGTDTDKVRDKARSLIESLKTKRPDSEIFHLSTDNFQQNIVDEYIGGQGLFFNKHIVYLNRVCEKKDTKDLLMDKLDAMKDSGNIFIIYEGKLDKATINKIENRSEKTIVYDLAESSNKNIKDNNIFEIANIFSIRDKKNLWIVYRMLIDNGNAPEEIHGILFWKIKSSLISNGNAYWKKEELLEIMGKMITIYHEARRGIGEIETGVERIILSL